MRLNTELHSSPRRARSAAAGLAAGVLVLALSGALAPPGVQGPARRCRGRRGGAGDRPAVQLRAQRPGGRPDRLRHVRRRQRHRLDREHPGRHGVPGRELLRRHQPGGRGAWQRQHRGGHRDDVRLRRVQRHGDHVGERGRLPARAGDHVQLRRRPRLDHELRRRGDDRRPPLRGDLQPGGGGQPDRADAHRQPAAVARADPAQPLGPDGGAAGPDGGPRLRGGVRPLRRQLPVAVGGGARRGGRLRPALRAHAGVLERAAGRDHADHRAARPEPGRRLPDRVHLHADHPVR